MTRFVKSFRACKLCVKEKNIIHSHYLPVNCIFDKLLMYLAEPFPEKNRSCRYILLSVEFSTGCVNTKAAAGETADI